MFCDATFCSSINNSAGFQLDRPSVTRPASTVGSTSPRGRPKAMDSGQVSLQISVFFNCFYESILILFEKSLPVTLFRLSHRCLWLKKLCSEGRLWSREIRPWIFALEKTNHWWEIKAGTEIRCWFRNSLYNLLVSVFNTANRKIIIILLLKQGRLKIFKPFAHVQKVMF